MTRANPFSTLGTCLVLLWMFSACDKEVPVLSQTDPDRPDRILSFNQVEGLLDRKNNVIMFPLACDSVESYAPVVSFTGYDSMEIRDVGLIKDQVNELGRVVANRPYKVHARLGERIDEFQLLFTTLPLVHIITSRKIPDDPKVLVKMKVLHGVHAQGRPGIAYFESRAGIEIRGNTSRRFDKKSYGIALWEEDLATDRTAALLGMRYGTNWILDAMYVDKFRFRNKLSFDIWKKISHTPRMDQKSEVFPGVHYSLVELFINDSYEGLYNLGERMDERLLLYSQNQYKQGGVLYKAVEWSDGSTSFEKYQHGEDPDASMWEGWELIYPSHQLVWNPLAELRDFVVNSNDSVFAAEIGTRMDLRNIVDFYLLINLLRANDNAGKNTFLARYTDHSPFFLIPWDMEGSWGRDWEGANSGTHGLVTYPLVQRLMETNAHNFKQELTESWNLYRESVFHKSEIMNLVYDHYSLLVSSGAIDRENDRWGVDIDLETEYSYLVRWVEARIGYLDQHFGP